MECPICRDLERGYVVRLREYTEARSSACFRVSKKFAAVKNVDMERARYELEEHRLMCVTAGKLLAPSAEQNTPAHWARLAA